MCCLQEWRNCKEFIERKIRFANHLLCFIVLRTCLFFARFSAFFLVVVFPFLGFLVVSSFLGFLFGSPSLVDFNPTTFSEYNFTKSRSFITPLFTIGYDVIRLPPDCAPCAHGTLLLMLKKLGTDKCLGSDEIFAMVVILVG